MFCNNCGTPILDGTYFCPNCGTPVNPCPVNAPKKKHYAIFISLIVLIIAAIAACLIIFVFNPTSGNSPKGVANKFMKSMVKGDLNGMNKCMLPDVLDGFSDSYLYWTADKFEGILDNGGKIQYKIYSYKKFDKDKLNNFKESLEYYFDVKTNKIKEVGTVKGKYIISDTGYTDESKDVTIFVVKYGSKWYVVSFDEVRIY